ncbi:hypothetical protein QJQ45_015246 [Haematococcus lacustris]|nr:hypothetical protein QJQ45_015246 [Haematococcus lacustris]
MVTEEPSSAPALFWDELPENPEQNADWAALEALRLEASPEERAETFKVNGNKKLQVGLKAKNKILLREAVEFYSKGLAEGCGNAKLNSVLLSNRSHVESLLGNWRKALDDAEAALRQDPTNIKVSDCTAACLPVLEKASVLRRRVGELATPSRQEGSSSSVSQLLLPHPMRTSPTFGSMCCWSPTPLTPAHPLHPLPTPSPPLPHPFPTPSPLGLPQATFRAARAALKLRLPAQALQYVHQGQALDPGAPEWPDLVKEAAAVQAVQQAAAKARAEEDAADAAAHSLADAIVARGIKMTGPQVRTEKSWKPSLDGSGGRLVWPLLVLYPESMVQDVIEAAGEEDTLGEHLDQMFGGDAPPLEFDQQREYNRASIELRYLSHAGKVLSRAQLVQALKTGSWPEDAEASGPNRYGANASKWVVCRESWTVRELLSRPDHVVPGVPLLFALAKGSAYRQRFLEKAQQ